MTGDINFFRIQQLINSISTQKKEESLSKSEKERLENLGYDVSDDSNYLNAMKAIGAENEADRKAVMEELSKLFEEIAKAVGGDKKKLSDILNDVFNKICASSDPDVQSLVRLLQEALAKAKGTDLSGKTEESKLEQKLAKFIQCQMITPEDYEELLDILDALSVDYNQSTNKSTFGDKITTVSFKYNNKKYEFRTNQIGDKAVVGDGSWTSQVIKGAGLDLDGEDGKYFIGVYYNYYRFDPDAIREDFPEAVIETPADLAKAKKAKNNPEGVSNADTQNQTDVTFTKSDLKPVIDAFGEAALNLFFTKDADGNYKMDIDTSSQNPYIPPEVMQELAKIKTPEDLVDFIQNHKQIEPILAGIAMSKLEKTGDASLLKDLTDTGYGIIQVIARKNSDGTYKVEISPNFSDGNGGDWMQNVKGINITNEEDIKPYLYGSDEKYKESELADFVKEFKQQIADIFFKKDEKGEYSLDFEAIKRYLGLYNLKAIKTIDDLTEELKKDPKILQWTLLESVLNRAHQGDISALNDFIEYYGKENVNIEYRYSPHGGVDITLTYPDENGQSHSVVFGPFDEATINKIITSLQTDDGGSTEGGNVNGDDNNPGTENVNPDTGADNGNKPNYAQIMSDITADLQKGGNAKKLAEFMATNPEGWTFNITTDKNGDIEVQIKSPIEEKHVQVGVNDVEGLAELCRWNEEQVKALGLSESDKKKYLVKDGDSYKLNTTAIEADFKGKYIKTIEQLKEAVDTETKEVSAIDAAIQRFVSGGTWGNFMAELKAAGVDTDTTKRDIWNCTTSDKKCEYTFKHGDATYKIMVKGAGNESALSLMRNGVDNDMLSFTLDAIREKGLYEYLDKYFEPNVTKTVGNITTHLSYTLKDNVNIPGVTNTTDPATALEKLKEILSPADNGGQNGNSVSTDPTVSTNPDSVNTDSAHNLNSRIQSAIQRFVSGGTWDNFMAELKAAGVDTDTSKRDIWSCTTSDTSCEYTIKHEGVTYKAVLKASNDQTPLALMRNGVDGDIPCYTKAEIDKLPEELRKYFYCSASAIKGTESVDLYYSLDYSKLPSDLDIKGKSLDDIIKVLKDYKSPEDKFKDAVMNGVTIAGYDDEKAKVTTEAGKFRDAFNALISGMKTNLEAEAKKILGESYDSKWQGVYDATVDEIVKKYKTSTDTSVQTAINDFISTIYKNLLEAKKSAPAVVIDDDVRAFIDNDIKPADILKDNKNVGSSKDCTYGGTFDDVGDVTDEIEATLNLLKTKLHDAIKARLGSKFSESEFTKVFDSTLSQIKKDYSGETDLTKLKVKNVVDDFIKRMYKASGIKEAEEAKKAADEAAANKLVTDARSALNTYIGTILAEKDEDKTKIIKDIIGSTDATEIMNKLLDLKTVEEIEAKKKEIEDKLEELKTARLSIAFTKNTDAVSEKMRSYFSNDVRLQFVLNADGSITFKQKDGDVFAAAKDYTTDKIFNTELKSALKSTYKDEIKAVFGNDTATVDKLFNLALYMTISGQPELFSEVSAKSIIQQTAEKFFELLVKAKDDEKALQYIKDYPKASILSGADTEKIDSAYYVHGTTHNDDDYVHLGEEVDSPIYANGVNSGATIKHIKTYTDQDDKQINKALDQLLEDYISKYKGYIDPNVIVAKFVEAEDAAFDKLRAGVNNDDADVFRNIYGYGDNGNRNTYWKSNVTIQSILVQIMFEMERELNSAIFS